MTVSATFHDPLVPAGTTGLADRFFDRFVFNLHPTDAVTPSVILGFGTYPMKDTCDGFVVVSDATEQRNLIFSTEWSTTAGDGAGPFRFDVVDPNREWRLTLRENPISVEFDVVWRARTAPWWGEVAVGNADAKRTAFDHLFQSGLYTGTLTVDGVTCPVDGWYGQRDRSRGVRTMSGGQGLHMWYQAQFPTYSIGFLLVETRGHERMLLKGGVMHTSGEVDPIVDVAHDLQFDDSLDLRSGRVRVTTSAGREYLVDADASAGGGYLAGAGYGGHHGKPLGRDHIASSRYLLDGTVTPRTLDSALTDRLATFACGGETGSGIFEFALTRSSSYSYRPSL